MEGDFSADGEPLIEALRAARPEAFRRLVETHGARLRGTALRLLKNEADAEDVVQETFLSAFRAIRSFEGYAKLGTWLHRIAVNASLMRLRSRKRRPEEEIHGLLPKFTDGGQHTRHLFAFGEPPDEDTLRRERAELVRACIDELPESYRIALILKDLEELEYDELSQALGLTRNATRIRVHRARQALRTLLAPHFERSPP